MQRSNAFKLTFKVYLEAGIRNLNLSKNQLAGKRTINFEMWKKAF